MKSQYALRSLIICLIQVLRMDTAEAQCVCQCVVVMLVTLRCTTTGNASILMSMYKAIGNRNCREGRWMALEDVVEWYPIHWFGGVHHLPSLNSF